MCGRFAAILHPEQLSRLFGVEGNLLVEPRYNIAPGQLAAIIRADAEHRRLDLFKWGLVPEGSDPRMGSHLINAWSETVVEKASFRHAIRYRRCLIPATGYYEWQLTRERGKQPYLVVMHDRSPMALAGLWESWKGRDGQPLETFTILTTAANRLVAPLHERMPVILDPDDFSLWLSRNMHDPQQLRHLYAPFPAERMHAFKVSDLVNDPHVNDQACLAPL